MICWWSWSRACILYFLCYCCPCVGGAITKTAGKWTLEVWTEWTTESTWYFKYSGDGRTEAWATLSQWNAAERHHPQLCHVDGFREHWWYWLLCDTTDSQFIIVSVFTTHSKLRKVLFLVLPVTFFCFYRVSYAKRGLGSRNSVRLSVSVRPSVRHTRALWLVQRTYRQYFYTTRKGNLSSFLMPKISAKFQRGHPQRGRQREVG